MVLAGSVEGPGVVGWQSQVVAEMRRWRLDGRNLSGTVELGRAYSLTSCAQLVGDSLRYIEPVQLGVQEPRQAVVKLGCTADHLNCGIQHSLQLVRRYFWYARYDSVAVVDA